MNIDIQLDILKQEIANMRSHLNQLHQSNLSMCDPLIVHYSQMLDHRINAYYHLSNEVSKQADRVVRARSA